MIRVGCSLWLQPNTGANIAMKHNDYDTEGFAQENQIGQHQKEQRW